jgi:hypothetical protein
MTTTTVIVSLTQQDGTGSAPRQTSPQRPATDQDLQNAARELREAFGNNANRERIQAQANAAANAATRAALAQGVVVEPTPPPAAPDIVFGRPGREGTISIRPGAFNNTIPPQAVDISIAFFITIAVIIIGLPLARAFARRMDRRGAGTQVPGEISAQLAQLNQAVDAIAVEVERISEGQRFSARLLSEQRDATARQTIPSAITR